MRGRSRGAGAVLHAGDLVQHAEDALGAGDGVLDVGPQDGDLLDRLVEALHVGQEGHHQAEGDGGAEQRLTAEQVQAAHAGHDGQRDVAERLQGGGERGGERHGADVGVPVGGVDFLELLDVLIGAGEGLHLADRGDAFLQLGIDVADLLAAAAEGLARLRREVDRGQEHQRRDGQRKQRQGTGWR